MKEEEGLDKELGCAGESIGEVRNEGEWVSGTFWEDRSPEINILGKGCCEVGC